MLPELIQREEASQSWERMMGSLLEGKSEESALQEESRSWESRMA